MGPFYNKEVSIGTINEYAEPVVVGGGSFE